MFRAFEKGFQLEFPNGLTASVMWGHGNYCDNRNGLVDQDNHGLSCRSAEFAVFRGKRGLFIDGSAKIDEETGEITVPQSRTGWLSPSQVSAALEAASCMPGNISQIDCIFNLNEVIDRYGG